MLRIFSCHALPCLLSYTEQKTVFCLHKRILLCDGILVADDAVIAAVRCDARSGTDQSRVERLHGQMVAVAQDRQYVLHVMAFRKLRIGALGEAVANDAVLLVVCK